MRLGHVCGSSETVTGCGPSGTYWKISKSAGRAPALLPPILTTDTPPFFGTSARQTTPRLVSWRTCFPHRGVLFGGSLRSKAGPWNVRCSRPARSIVGLFGGLETAPHRSVFPTDGNPQTSNCSLLETIKDDSGFGWTGRALERGIETGCLKNAALTTSQRTDPFSHLCTSIRLSKSRNSSLLSAC